MKKCILPPNRWLKPSPVSKKTTESTHHYNSLLAGWAESFIFAGSSALLLLIASLQPLYWYFSLFALVPFLYKIIQATPIESLRLGILFSISFFAVSVIDSLPISPIPSVIKLILGTGLFAVFGWTVAWSRRHWGFCPAIVAILWFGIELGVMKLGVSGGIFDSIETSTPLLQGLITLLGLLTVSVIIILLNSLLVFVIIRSLRLAKSKDKITIKGKTKWDIFSAGSFCIQKNIIIPKDRAPPLSISLQNIR